MAWSDDIALLDLKIARQQRWVDWYEGVNSNVFGPRGENADWSNPSHTDGCNPDDTTGASNHRWTGTGGANAYFAWWRSQYPSVDENETDALTLGVYEQWKNWNDNLSQDIANEADYTTTLNSHKTTVTELQTKKATLQAKIDNGDLDGDPNA